MLLIFLAMLKGLTQFRRNVLETFHCAEQLIARQTTNLMNARALWWYCELFVENRYWCSATSIVPVPCVRIDLFSLYVLFSQWARDILYVRGCTWIGRDLKETVLLGNITWSAMGKHNIQAKKSIKRFHSHEQHPCKFIGKKRKRLHKKRVQFPQDWFGTPTWPPFHCFGTPIWRPWRHVKTLYYSGGIDHLSQKFYNDFFQLK